MESEEYEQIPWANLVADAQPTIDKRLYIVGGVVAMIVAIVLVTRMSSPGGSGPPPVSEGLAHAPVPQTQNLTVATDPTSIETPVAVVTEADLMASIEPNPIAPNTFIPDTRLVVVAEWFVTDFFTRDGSNATVESLKARLAPDMASDLPHHNPDEEQFVEWAKVFSVDEADPGYEVLVAFRTVHRTDSGFVRDPVRAVAVRLLADGDSWIVAGLPTSAETP